MCSSTILEIRSTGAQTVVPGSTHPSGEAITQCEGTAEILVISAEALKRAASRTAGAAILAREWKTISGSRHDAALALTGALLHSGWDTQDVTIFLGAVINAGDDDEPTDRLRAVTNTIAKHEAGEAITGWPTLSEHISDGVIRKAREWLGIIDGANLKFASTHKPDTWPEAEPLQRELPAPEPYPLDALGEVLGGMANAMQSIIQTPDAVCGQSVLAAAGLAVQGHADVEIDGRQYPTSLFNITVAESGDRKTAADREALAPHRAFQRKKLEETAAEREEYEKEFMAWRKARDQALANKHLKSVEEKKAALDELGPGPPAPITPILTVSEPTYEGLSKALYEDWPSMGLFSDEGGRFLGGYGMDQQNVLKTAAGLSELWDGSPVTRTRSGEGSTVMYGRRLSLHLMIQPVVSNKIFDSKLLMDQGLVSRCLVAYPTSVIGTRRYNERSLSDTDAAKRYFARLSDILEAPLPIVPNTRNELAPRRIGLAPDAKATWIKFHDHVEALVAGDRALHDVRGLGSKAAEHCLRIAAVLALVDDIAITLITQRHLEAAIELVEYYLSEALRLFGLSAVDTDLVLAQRTLQFLLDERQSNGPSIKLSRIYQYGPNGVRSKAPALHILNILHQHGWVRQLEDNYWEVRP